MATRFRLVGISLVVLLVVSVAFIGSCHSGSDGGQVLTAATQLRGDLDDDGNPSINDAIGILRIVVGLAGPNQAADADGDGGTSVNDAIAVLRCVVGLAQWPLGEFTLEPTRTIGPGVVVESDFTVGADEIVECLGETTVQCDTATIAGELFTRSATAPGGDGPDIAIEAQGDIVVTGAVNAGSGAAGADESKGGDGGSIALRSVAGGITVGVEAATAVVTPQARIAPGLHAGDGADGGDGEAGGAGGAGGIITLDCSSGTLTVHQAAGLLHVGNGGDGGDAILQSVPESGQATGGDGGVSGAPVLRSTALDGLDFEDSGEQFEGEALWWVTADEGTVTGGVGGAGGDAAIEAPEASSARARSVKPAADTVVVVDGGGGANGWEEGGAGGGATADLANEPMPVGGDGWDAEAQGGTGGWGGVLDSNWSGCVNALKAYFCTVSARGGAGGDAMATGADGGAGGPCQPGGKGGKAKATGGLGGAVSISFGWTAGQGGAAYAFGGRGGAGGPCCVPPNTGGAGGAGGSAEAKGGDGGIIYRPEGTVPFAGTGGAADAIGGNGGPGGNGTPPGAGGGGGTATAQGGEGAPKGSEIATDGSAGPPGGACPTHRIAGRVTDKTGAGVPSLDMRYLFKYPMTEMGCSGEVAPTQARYVTTDINGVYMIPDLDPGTYWVQPMGDPGGPDYWSPPARLVGVAAEDVSDQDFQLATATSKYTITVRVINDNTGYPVPNETLRLIREGHGSWQAITDWDGYARFTDLWPGVYTAQPPETTTYNYQPATIDIILLDQDGNRSFRVTPQ